ncbi:MAG: hypothetical protein JOZ77_10505 [Candidatus Eremiobacteraeota bacterium]|nr:hypothetical protein [Candidatus Eremiobacteraeota bacterium]
MISFLLAAVLTAADELHTLAGVTLGNNVREVLSEHPDAQRPATGFGRWWRWSRRGGGMVTITADDLGRITRVDFQADKGQRDYIDLPCLHSFPVQDSHVNLELALERTPCSAFNGLTYGVPDRSVVEVRFHGPYDGQLVEATWYRPSDKNASPVGHMDAVIDYLRPALTYVGGTARVYYAGECRPFEQGSSGPRAQHLLFPAVYLQPPRQEATGITTVRQIFRDDPNVTVIQDQAGMTRITIGGASTAILQTRIQALTLSRYAQYSAPSAVVTIESAPEVSAAKRRLNIGTPFRIIDIIVSGPIPGAPHLPRLLQNVTVDEALDSVIRTFKGIVMYGICKQPDGKDLFTLDYVYDS